MQLSQDDELTAARLENFAYAAGSFFYSQFTREIQKKPAIHADGDRDRGGNIAGAAADGDPDRG